LECKHIFYIFAVVMLPDNVFLPKKKEKK